MDRDVDGASAFIHDFNHLLIGVALGHAYQSAKLAYAMIYMHHIVTHLKLLDFF